MAAKDVFKVSFKTFFNPVAWLNVREIQNNTRIIKDIVKDTFKKPEQTTVVETFDEAMKRQNLTEDDVQQTASSFALFRIIFASLTIASFLSSFYFLIHYHTVAGWILALAVTAIFASQAFRFSFLLFQIKQRRLGCTFQEWWRGK